MRPKTVHATISSPTNIAVIKYWGKRDAKVNTPINSSVSLTLNQRDLRTVTTVTASTEFAKDQLWLNGDEEDLPANKRMVTVLREVRARGGDLKDAKGNVLVAKSEWAKLHVRVVSMNNFPTAAGLASSAAGYAALTFALAELMAVKESYPGELSTIARQVRPPARCAPRCSARGPADRSRRARRARAPRAARWRAASSRGTWARRRTGSTRSRGRWRRRATGPSCRC
jgi:diphosphomevalonate decarboxylase